MTSAMASSQGSGGALSTPRRGRSFLPVAGFVTQALSNRQIADRLVLSERTVESHVRNILIKFGLTNRTELTAHLPGDHP
jgi:DNA-binding NarL/FixJ family response regulator